ncbi:MAG TPA: hypothetical protein VMB73_07050 [Acetobacteraceae bacterium]|jgi:hypothetical protein|nr:hypothetical protein [Acetobacteraceae bacterium]
MLKTLAAAVALIGATAALQGCAYDPATGTYVPCCAYPAYPAYGYGYYPPVVGGVVVGGGWRGGWYRW